MKRPAALQIPALLAISLAAIATAAIGQAPAARSTSVQSASYGNLPLGFEANQGQTNPSVQFLVHGQGYTLFLRPSEAVLALNPIGGQSKAGVSMKLLGANLKAAATPEDKQITRTNYFLGSNPAQWRTDIPNYSRVRYRSVYDGIDLVYYGNQRRLEHDFVVAPKADPGQIVFSLDSPQNAHIDPTTGDLVLFSSPNEEQATLRLLKPVAYQEFNGHRTHIASGYTLLGQNKVGFSLGAYDHTRPLIIDPVLTYSTYLGGTGSNGNGDQGNGIAVDSAGNAYVVGTAYSTNFPVTSGAFKTQSNVLPGVSTVFVTKLNAAGTALIYSTYLGGSGGDAGYGIALDAQNNAYITGATYSVDFPVTCDAFQTDNPSKTNGATTGFIAKLNADGNALSYSTYLGGSGNSATPAHGDVSQAIAVDSTSSAYVTGYTWSSNFPTTDHSLQPDFAGNATVSNAFVTKLNPTGTALAYSTYLGGSGSNGVGDYGNAIALDTSGDAFVTGTTASNNFPVTSGVLQARLAGSSNAFVTELNPTGTDEVYSTYLGGSGSDSAQAIAVDNSGFAYIAGNTSSGNFPLTSGTLEGTGSGIGPYLAAIGTTDGNGTGATGAFVTKLNANGSALKYSTYLEGGFTTVSGLAVDSAGAAYITGSAPTAGAGIFFGFQSTPDAPPVPTGSTSAFLVKLDPSAAVLNYATLLGGSSNDKANALALGATGNVYLTGIANSTDFPTTIGAFQTYLGAPPGSLIPTTLTVISQSMECGGPGDMVDVNLMVNSNGATQAPTGTVSFTGSFNVGEYAIPVVPDANGTATVDLIGTDSVGYFTGASWQAVYTGDSTYAPSSLSGSVTCTPSSSVSKNAAGAYASSGQPELAAKPSAQALLPAESPRSNARSAFSPRPENLSSATGTNAFVSQFALAAETNQTVYPSLPTGGIPTSLAIDYENMVPGFDWALDVGLTLSSGIPGPPPTGTITFANGTGIYSPVSVPPTWTGTTGVIDMWEYNLYYAGPTTWEADYSGDALYQPSTITGLSIDPPCYPNCCDPNTSCGGDESRSAQTGHAIYALPTASKAIGKNSTSSIGASPLGPKFIPSLPISNLETGKLRAQNSFTSQAIPACLAPPQAGVAATPTFSPTAGNYTSAQSVVISDATAGATIYYTVNGTTPTTSSTRYSGPINVSASETLQAIAVAAGYTNSAVGSAVYTIGPPTAQPIFSIAAGIYTSTQTVTITDFTAGAVIYYTTDRTAPTTSSQVYSEPIIVSADETLSAIAVATGYSASAVTSAAYQFQVATPVFSPSGGTYTSPQSVTISSTTSGAIIYYTLNGTTPTTKSVLYSGPLSIANSSTLQAIAYASGEIPSGVASATYTLDVAAPVFSPPSGTYPGPLTVTISDATPAAKLAYTPNGNIPTQFATYTGPITITSSGKVYALAQKTGFTTSPTVEATYTIQPSTTAELQFVPIVPCRVADTRNPAGPFGGPELAGDAARTFDIQQSACNIPATAAAYSLNVTVVPDLSIGYLTVWPAGQSQPIVSTLNSDGRVKANAAIVQAGANGGVNVYTTDPTQVILDIDGYFVPAGASASALEFYPLTPCRIADTRNPTGTLAGPFLAANISRDFPVLSSACNIPPAAKAYSLNVTAVPHGPLGYLTAWPSGQTQPAASTLNSSTGAVAANAAIVSAGSSGNVAVYATNDTDVILDINGYFAPPATGGLSFYTATPCRVLDTRNSSGPFDGILTVPVQTSTCAPPAKAQAYILNATALPVTALGYMTFWAAGATQPGVSTLNASDGTITSNMVIVAPAQGAIDAYSTNSTNLILDLSGYFAP